MGNGQNIINEYRNESKPKTKTMKGKNKTHSATGKSNRIENWAQRKDSNFPPDGLTTGNYHRNVIENRTHPLLPNDKEHQVSIRMIMQK